MGRPTKLTPEARAQIIKALDAGSTRVDAANSAGVDYMTFLNWMKRGAVAKKGDFFEFFRAVNKSESDVRVRLANALAKASLTDWRAAEAYLKRRDPANWGDRIQVSKLSDDELIRLIALAESIGIEGGGETTGPDPVDEIE